MKCPACNTTDLLMAERLNIEIDYCPQCRGVWLDCGELDKIIERSLHEATPGGVAAHQVPPMPAMPMSAQYDSRYNQRDGHHDDHHDRHDSRDRHGYPQKKSFWRELFD